MNHKDVKTLMSYIKYMICEEVRKYRPELTDSEIFKRIEDKRIVLVPARNSSWPFGSPMIPPKVEFKE